MKAHCAHRARCNRPAPLPPQTNEIRNGRLAMIACLGMAAQGVMTKEGPFANLLEHLSDPVSHNFLTSASPGLPPAVRDFFFSPSPIAPASNLPLRVPASPYTNYGQAEAEGESEAWGQAADTCALFSPRRSPADLQSILK